MVEKHYSIIKQYASKGSDKHLYETFNNVFWIMNSIYKGNALKLEGRMTRFTMVLNWKDVNVYVACETRSELAPTEHSPLPATSFLTFTWGLPDIFLNL